MRERAQMVNTQGALTMSESPPRCSGSRGFSSVICCSFIPAILASNLQSPWQQNTHTADTHTHIRLHCHFILQSTLHVVLKKQKVRDFACSLLYGNDNSSVQLELDGMKQRVMG